MFDLSHITTIQVVIVALVLTMVDFVGAVLPALIASLGGGASSVGEPAFNAGLVAQFLDTHILKRVFPIFGLLVISSTLGHDQAAGAAIFALAIAGLAAYLAETVQSIASHLPAAQGG